MDPFAKVELDEKFWPGPAMLIVAAATVASEVFTQKLGEDAAAPGLATTQPKSTPATDEVARFPLAKTRCGSVMRAGATGIPTGLECWGSQINET